MSKSQINTATYICEVPVVDPDSKGTVHVSMFKHEQSGGIFGIDSSFLDQCFDDDERVMVADPLNKNCLVELDGI